MTATQSTQSMLRVGAAVMAAVLAMPPATLLAQRDRRGSGGSVRQSRNQARRPATNTNVNRNTNINQNTNVNVNRNVNVNTRPVGRRTTVVAGEEGAVAVGRRGA